MNRSRMPKIVGQMDEDDLEDLLKKRLLDEVETGLVRSNW
jgi:hypothetical protein